MAWVRVDDAAIEHEKLLAAGPEGVTLWLAGLSYCNRQARRDGRIPDAKVSTLYPLKRPKKVAERLVDVRLWERVEGGYLIHDYHEYQPKQAENTSKAEAGRLGGQRSGEARRAKQNEAGASKQNEADTEAESKLAHGRARVRAHAPGPDPGSRIPDPVPIPGDPPTPPKGDGGGGGGPDPLVVALGGQSAIREHVGDIVGLARRLRAMSGGLGASDAHWIAATPLAAEALDTCAIGGPLNNPAGYLLKVFGGLGKPSLLRAAKEKAAKPLKSDLDDPIAGERQIHAIHESNRERDEALRRHQRALMDQPDPNEVPRG